MSVDVAKIQQTVSRRPSAVFGYQKRGASPNDWHQDLRACVARVFRAFSSEVNSGKASTQCVPMYPSTLSFAECYSCIFKIMNASHGTNSEGVHSDEAAMLGILSIVTCLGECIREQAMNLLQTGLPVPSEIEKENTPLGEFMVRFLECSTMYCKSCSALARVAAPIDSALKYSKMLSTAKSGISEIECEIPGSLCELSKQVWASLLPAYIRPLAKSQSDFMQAVCNGAASSFPLIRLFRHLESLPPPENVSPSLCDLAFEEFLLQQRPLFQNYKYKAVAHTDYNCTSLKCDEHLRVIEDLADRCLLPRHKDKFVRTAYQYIIVPCAPELLQEFKECVSKSFEVEKHLTVAQPPPQRAQVCGKLLMQDMYWFKKSCNLIMESFQLVLQTTLNNLSDDPSMCNKMIEGGARSFFLIHRVNHYVNIAMEYAQSCFQSNQQARDCINAVCSDLLSCVAAFAEHAVAAVHIALLPSCVYFSKVGEQWPSPSHIKPTLSFEAVGRLLRYIPDRDVFERHYLQMLAIRLSMQTANLELEFNCIRCLQVHMAQSFSSKAEQVIQDAIHSCDFLSSPGNDGCGFSRPNTSTWVEDGCGVNSRRIHTVFKAGTFTPPAVHLPKQTPIGLQEAFQQIEQVYPAMHPKSRKLTPATSLSTAMISTVIEGKNKIFVCSIAQTCIIQVMNSRTNSQFITSWQDIEGQSGIPTSVLKSHADALEQAGVIRTSESGICPQEKLRALSKEYDVLTPGAHPALLMRFPRSGHAGILNTVTPERSAAGKDRKALLTAAVVRLLKRNKMMPLETAMKAIAEEVSKYFDVGQEEILAILRIAEDKEYVVLEVLKDGTDVVKYVA